MCADSVFLLHISHPSYEEKRVFLYLSICEKRCSYCLYVGRSPLKTTIFYKTKVLTIFESFGFLTIDTKKGGDYKLQRFACTRINTKFDDFEKKKKLPIKQKNDCIISRFARANTTDGRTTTPRRLWSSARSTQTR